MKYTFLLFTSLSIFFTSCTSGQSTSTNLLAADFQTKIKETENAVIIDVRTPEEFAGGFIENAINIDWNNSNFNSNILKIDKSKPVFVYCLSGGRSGKAAAQMRSEGFKEVYELNGGMMAWRSAALPETTSQGSEPKEEGMTLEAYNKLINSEKLVLIDFYAEWCGPCKKMAPSLDQISKEMADKVTIIRIDADKNPGLGTALKIEALPTLLLYKGNELIWRNLGFQTKEQIVNQLK
jgi:thioredoxin 1